MSNNEQFKQKVIDVVLDLLKWIGLTIGAFIYWMAVLMLLSIFLLNIWMTSYEKILLYSAGLTAITSIIYAIILLRRRLK